MNFDLDLATLITLISAIILVAKVILKQGSEINALKEDQRESRAEQSEAKIERQLIRETLAHHVQDSEKHVNQLYLQQIEKQLDRVVEGQKSFETKLDRLIEGFITKKD